MLSSSPKPVQENISVLKWCCILFLISLGIRLVFLIPVIRGHTPAIWDEYEYFDRAGGFQNIVMNLFQGKLPTLKDWALAYSATWPPVQAFVLSLGFLIFGNSLAVGRTMMVVLAAATTPLVYLVTNKLSNRRAALVASIGFAIQPNLIHYSHRLLSETTYIFLFFLMFYVALKMIETIPLRQAVSLGAITGCLLAICTLTRAAGLLLTPAVALWAGWRSAELRKRIWLPIIILIASGVTLLPWHIVLWKVEGRLALVTASSDLNLYYGNNPWLADGYGSGPAQVTQRVRSTALEYSQQHGISFYDACRALAMQEIKSSPIKFLKRAFDKMRAMWSADFPLLRHMLMVVYPTMSQEAVSLIWLAALSGLFGLLALAIVGLWTPAPTLRYRELIVGVILAAMVPSLVTIGQPRYSIPLLAALLPAAGHGLAHWKAYRQKTCRPQAIAALASLALVGTIIYSGFPYEYSMLPPSSYYSSLVRSMDRWLNRSSVVSDRLLFRASGDNLPEYVDFTIMGDGFEFTGLGTRTFRWNTSVQTGTLDLAVESPTSAQPFQLQLSAESYGQTVTLTLNDLARQVWRPANLPGIEYMWVGSSRFPLNALDVNRPE